jgi:hypothetical protein
MESGEGMLFAWDIHEPAAFISACSFYGYGPEDVDKVRHERYIKTWKRGRFNAWYESVQGTPNATVLLP